MILPTSDKNVAATLIKNINEKQHSQRGCDRNRTADTIHLLFK